MRVPAQPHTPARAAIAAALANVLIGRRFSRIVGIVSAVAVWAQTLPQPVQAQSQRESGIVVADASQGDWAETGTASWYGPGFAGRPTASGETYDPQNLTAAHRSLPLGSLVRVHNLTPPTESELARQIDQLVSQRIDLVTLPPLQFHVMRGLPAGDLVVIRWPHALMDARGCFVLLDAIDQMYREQTEPAGLVSVGDELLDGLSQLLRNTARPQCPATRTEEEPPAAGEDLQLPICPDFRELGPLRSIVHRLDEDECRQIQDIAKRTCAPAQFGAFLRACGVRTLHRMLARHNSRGAGYSVPFVVEARWPPYLSPVCRNLFTAERLFVPAKMAIDRPAVARLLHEGTTRLAAAGPNTRKLKRSLAVTSLPTALLAHLVRHSLIYPPQPWQQDAVSNPPSLPMAFMQVFGDKKRSFCGAEVRYVHSFRPPLPRQGIGIQVMGGQGRLAVCGLSYEVRWNMMNRFLDHFIEELLSPD